MPEVTEFLAGFHLIQGYTFVLSNVFSTHESIKRYQEYLFHITLTFNPYLGAKYEDLYDVVLSEISQEHTIYGARDPYKCTIDLPIYGNIEEDTNGTIVFHLTGHAIKICRGTNCLQKILS